MNADTWSREKWARIDDTAWYRVQRSRRWLKIGSWAYLALSLVAGVYLVLEADVLRQGILLDAARLRAEAAEIRLAIEYQRCQAFPSECKLRQSVFFQRQPATRR